MSESQPEQINPTESNASHQANAQQASVASAAPAAGKSSRIVALLAVLVLLSIGTGAYYSTNERAYESLCRAVTGDQRKRRANPLMEFNVANAIIPKDQILNGGPGKDGIPAISKPKFITPAEADYLKPDDRVMGVELDGEARAYPLRILISHENVNDTIGEHHIAVVYCPLCDSASVLDRKTADGEVLEFGISGLLYNSNVLLFDRSEKESLWSQMQRQSVAGEKVKQRLKTLPMVLTTWEDWQKQHPDTKVLSTNTGFGRDYSHMPYEAYFVDDELMFPFVYNNPYPQIKHKAKMLCIWTDNKSRCYPLDVFQQEGEAQTLKEELDGKSFELTYNPDANSLQITNAEEGLEWMYSFWFAWAAFHEKVEVYQVEKLTALTNNAVEQPAADANNTPTAEPVPEAKE